MDAIETQYVDRDGVALAYQVVGSGHDLLAHYELNGHLDLIWSDPYFHAIYEQITPIVRIALMQRRGVGLSDPVSRLPTIEEQADDVLAVMDAIGMRRATLFGAFSTCATLSLVAARNPERVQALVLAAPFPSGIGSDVALEHGWPREQQQQLMDQVRGLADHWGSGITVDYWDKNQATGYNKRLMGMMERCSTTPNTVRAYAEWILRLDFSDIFRAVTVPTRILRVPDNMVPDQVVRTVAQMIPGSEYVELPRSEPGMSMGEAWVPIWENVIEVATGGTQAYASTGRFLGTVMFTDVVGSTELLTALGDVDYREVIGEHERHVRLEVERAGGRLVKVTGDGTFSLFDGPSRAVECARAVCDYATELGIDVRAGVHTGEVEHTAADDLTGMTVHIGARVAGSAGAGEVVVSRTVRDLAIGSGLRFHGLGTRELKGVPGEWELFAFTGDRDPVATIAPQGLGARVTDRAALRLAQRAPRLTRSAVAAGNAWQRRRTNTG